jgi:predicted GNAT family N-acyltransferase
MQTPSTDFSSTGFSNTYAPRQRITLRVIDEFDPRVNELRCLHYGRAPANGTMKDEFDADGALHLVAYCAGKAVGAVRLSRWTHNAPSPMHRWIDRCRLATGTHVVDLNRAVVAREFRQNGLCRLLLAACVEAALRLGFKTAIAAIEERSVLLDLFDASGFQKVGGIVDCHHGAFKSRVQPMQTPLHAAQTQAREQMRQARASLHKSGFELDSRVNEDIARLTPPAPTRWQETVWGRHLVDSLSLVCAITPLYTLIELFVLRMPGSVVLNTRLWMVFIVFAGLGSMVSRLRDRSLRLCTRAFGPLTGTRLRIHDVGLAWLINGTIAPTVYWLSGATSPQIVSGTITALLVGSLSGPLMGAAIDRGRAVFQARKPQRMPDPAMSKLGGNTAIA